jgi:hypothetical protein
VFNVQYAKAVVGKSCRRLGEENIIVKIVLKVPLQMMRALKDNHSRDLCCTIINCSHHCYKLSIIWVCVVYSFTIEGDIDSITSNYPNLEAAFIKIRHIYVLHIVASLAPIELSKMPLHIINNMCGQSLCG